MLLRQRFDDLEWLDVTKEIDRRLAHVIREQVGSFPMRAGMADEIAWGFRNLDEWRRGFGEPDYSRLGVAIAYLFKYMSVRVSSVVASLCLSASKVGAPPIRVLDIGSGTDATRLALEFCLAPPCRACDGHPSLSLVCLEPSHALRSVGESIPFGPGLMPDSVTRYTGSLDLADLTLHAPPALGAEPRFDIVVLSAVFPYQSLTVRTQEYWDNLASYLAQLTTDPGYVIVIEPSSKKEICHRLCRSFQRIVGCVAEVSDSIGPRRDQNDYGLGRVVRQHQMYNMERLLEGMARQLYASDKIGAGGKMVERMLSEGINSWNALRAECSLVARVSGHKDGVRPIAPARLL